MIEMFWSRQLGCFVDKKTGEVARDTTFNGTIYEWYETLIELMIDLTNQVIRANGGKPIESCGWYVDASIKPIIETSVLYNVLSIEAPFLGTIGADQPGVVCNVPVRADPGLYEKRVIELRQADRILGKVQVIGFDG